MSSRYNGAVEEHTQQTRKATRRLVLAIALGLVAVSIAPFWPVCTFDFVNLDDGLYVYANPHIQEGVSWSGIRWAFTTLYASFWYPVTWLSYMVDYELYGLAAGGYHLTNLVLHTANALLLFGALLALLKVGADFRADSRGDSLDSGAAWKCGFVAALFAIHPQHVETVAWISDRKDLLCTLFLFLMLIAYARYVSKGGVGCYGHVAALLALGLMAKSMIATAPFVLLLLDVWPLGRFRAEQVGEKRLPRQAAALVLEKAPLFAIVAVFGVLSVLGQRQEGAMSSLEGLPLGMRAANAVYSYAMYLVKTVWPAGLAAFYPHPRDALAFWQVAGANAALLGITLAAMRVGPRRPYVAVGWFWYLGTLVPVSGFVQVGTHGMADRYTYIPLIGLFIVAAWGAPDLLRGWRRKTPCLAAAGGIVIVALLVVTAFQVRHWRNTETLFRHAIRVTEGSVLAYRTLGRELMAQGRYREAEPQFRQWAELRPTDPDAHMDWATALLHDGKPERASAVFAEAVALAPDDCRAHNGLGVTLLQQGQAEGAQQHLAEAVRLCPDFTDARTNLGAALLALGRWEEAAVELRQALEAVPHDPDIHTNLAAALIELGDAEAAKARLEEALRLDPSHVQARRNWARLGAR